MNAHLRPLLHTMLTLDEGVRRHPYVDTVGKVNIGIGRNLTDRGLSDDEIEYLFNNDIDIATKDACNAVGTTVFENLSVVRQAVLVDMAFNLGLARLLTFTSFLLAVKQGRYNDAAQDMLNSKWASQVGARATRLSNLMESG